MPAEGYTLKEQSQIWKSCISFLIAIVLTIVQ